MNPYAQLSMGDDSYGRSGKEGKAALESETPMTESKRSLSKNRRRTKREKAKADWEQPGRADERDFAAARAVIQDFRSKIADGSLRDKTLFQQLTLTRLLDDLGAFIDNPNLTALNFNTWYCGPAAALNVAINYDPLSFVEGVIELGLEGETRAFNRWKKLQLSDRLVQNGFMPGHSPVDNILGLSLKHAEEGLLKRIAKDDSKFEQGTFPWETDDMLRKLGIRSQKKRWYRPFGDKALENIEKAVAEGKIPIVFENHLISKGRLTDTIFDKIGLHYIPIHSFEMEGEWITFQYWDYAQVKYKKRILREDFLKGMKGYWIPRNKRRN